MKTHDCILIAIAIACLSPFLTGCGNQENLTDTAPPSIIPREPEAAPEPVRNYLIVTDPGVQFNAAPAYAEVSILRAQVALLHMYNLQPGVPLEGTSELRDEKGAILSTNRLSFVPTTSEWWIWDTFTPDYQSNQAGRWNWTMRIQGVGVFHAPIVVLPPTPAEMERLARHEQARENLLRAFGSYWMARGEHLFTKVDGTDPIYIQVRDWTPSVSEGSVTRADNLNGIAYQGGAQFTFGVHRIFDGSTGGWSEWVESNQKREDLLKTLAARTPLEKKQDLPAILRLQFSIMQKDGNWFVKTPTGERFANGKRVEGTNAPVAAPTGAEVEVLLATGKVPLREMDKALGDAAKSDPEAIERDLIETMRIVRGHTLR